MWCQAKIADGPWFTFGAMITPALAERARLHVRRFFSKHMPHHLRFHDVEHTLSVTAMAKSIGRASGLKGQALLQLEVAALFHDTGYALKYNGHEAESAKLATAWMGKAGVAGPTIRKVAALIMATRLGEKPRTLAQCVLRDADSAKAGQADFLEKSTRLKAEVEACTGKPIAAVKWRRENLAYLRSHRFYTTYAEHRFGRQKEINLRVLGSKASSHRAARKAAASVREPFMDRDLSWLAFNARVLQEAQDPGVPLLERLKFVAIHSSNLDEFYRVRVAQLRNLRKLGKWNRSALGVPPDTHIEHINREALKQQQALGKVYRTELIPALAEHGLRIRNEKQLTRHQRTFVQDYFNRAVVPLLRPLALRQPNAIFIEDRKLYLVLAMARKDGGKSRRVVLNVPSDTLGRFLLLPAHRGGTDLIYLDDVIRAGLAVFFKGSKVKSCHAIKVSRDAELYLDEEYTEDVAEKVGRSLRKRKTGVTARFLYDAAMPRTMLAEVRQALNLKKGDMVEGGRYHNLSDLASLPIADHANLRDTPLPPLAHPAWLPENPLRALEKGDILLHFPYHSFSHITGLLEYAASNPAVRRIAITLYRVAQASLICASLVKAARNGKRVDVVMEIQARFDEGNNLHWATLLKEAGAHVSYGVPGYKVHAKLLLLEHGSALAPSRLALLGTGNFNEHTAGVYSDLSLLTARNNITGEVAAIFRSLMKNETPGNTTLLSTSPDQLRAFLEQAIDREIEHAFLGKQAGIFLKLNSLEDKPLIRKLYDAGRAGVTVRLIVRGMCCLVADMPGYSRNINAISIVDRFLEHARAYVFHNAGKPSVYLASADWMERNLDRRVEVAFPVLDRKNKAEILRYLEIQWADNVKARVLDARQTNARRRLGPGIKPVRSQITWYRLLKKAGE